MKRPALTACLVGSLVLGGSACDRRTPVEVPNVAPRAQFNFNPVAPVYAGQTTVGFSASGSIDTDGTIARYVWEFGDGSAPIEAGSTLTHVFRDTVARCLVATYSVQLTIYDDDGDRDVIAHNIDVIELPDPRSLECQELAR